MAQLLESFEIHYPRYQYSFVEFFVEHLTDLSRTFDGDFQQIMLLAILGQRRLNELRRTRDGEEASIEGMSITASRLADVTGIPRETVRRKLALLEDRGWIAQASDGSWSIVIGDGDERPVRRDLAAFDDRARRRVARLVAALEALAPRPRD
jgi:predicted transcriptional regulator